MRNEKAGEPDGDDGIDGGIKALHAAVDDAIEPPGALDWDHVMRAAWFGVDRDPDAPVPRDVVDRGDSG